MATHQARLLTQHQSKDGPLRILVGVCTYNEAANIREAITRIGKALPQADILVVDDASPDGTSQLVHEFSSQQSIPNSVRCIVRDDRGLGGAIRTAMQTAIENQYDLFCNLDADLSHDPADLPRLVDALIQNEVDVAVASRYVAGGDIIGWPSHRKWMSRAINSLAKRKLGLPVNDASGSFRCYRVASLATLDWKAQYSKGDQCSSGDQWSNGYAFIQQVLLRLHRQGSSFTEVPITFTERVEGSSKLDLREAIRSGWTVMTLK